MISIWGPDLNYTPDYWPFWLKIGAVLVLLVIVGILGHALLRVMFSKKTTAGEMHKTYMYILPVRLWHWLNALFFIALLVTGILNHFTIGPTASMVKIHHLLGKMYLGVWALFIIMGVATGNMKHYVMTLSGIVGRIWKQAMYYLYGILKGEPHPFAVTAENKFNPIQQVSYIGVMFALVPLILASGLLALYAKSAWALVIHFGLAIVGLMFIFIHVYMCTTGDKPSYLVKGMIDGYHREDSH